MRPEWAMIPGLVIGSVIGAILSAKFPEFTLGFILPLLILVLAGIFTLDITGKMYEWMHDPNRWLP